MMIEVKPTGASEVKTKSMAVQASDILRGQIIRGELAPGSHLIEDDYVKNLGISKVSLREAFALLIQEGILEKVNNKYTRVVVFSKNDVREMFELRVAVEQLCIERCIVEHRVPTQDLIRQAQKVESLIDENGKSLNYEEFVNEDMRFHEILVEAAGNGRALTMWRQIQSQMKMLFFSQVRRYPFSVQNIPELQHEYIVEVMGQGRIEVAQQLLRRHIYGSYVIRISDPMLRE